MTEELKLRTGGDKEPEADDPMELVMTRVPGADPEFMATCLIEEYARMGMGEDEILRLFAQPVYQTHALYRERGETWVRSLIRNVLARTGRMRISLKVAHHQPIVIPVACEEAATGDQQPHTGGCDV